MNNHDNSNSFLNYDANSLDNQINTEEANANLELALKFVQSQSQHVDGVNGTHDSTHDSSHNSTDTTDFNHDHVTSLLNQAQQHQNNNPPSLSNDDDHSDYYQEDDDLPRKRGPGRPRKSRGIDDDGRAPRKARAPRMRDEISKSTKGKYALLRDKSEVDEDKRYLDEFHGIVMTTGQAVLQSHISRILLQKISEAGIGQASGEAYGRLPNGFTASPSIWLEPHGCDISGWPDGLPPTAIGGWTNHQLYAVLRLLLEDPHNITIYRTDGKPAIPPRPFQGKRRSTTVAANSPAKKRSKKKATSSKNDDYNSLGVGTSSSEADAQAAAAAAAALQQQHFQATEPSSIDLDIKPSLFDLQFASNETNSHDDSSSQHLASLVDFATSQAANNDNGQGLQFINKRQNDRITMRLSWIVGLTLAASVTCSDRIRGVDPSLAHLYQPTNGRFQCLNDATTIAYTSLNDDYCDCPDGTDEPSTSACSGRHHTPQFYCHNEHYTPSRIHLSRVGDGLCEEECCDGSDEAEGVCANTCTQRAHRRAVHHAHSQRVRERALVTKRAYVERGLEVLGELRSSVQAKQANLLKTERAEKAGKDEVDRLETLAKDALDARLASPLYKHLLDSRNALETLALEKRAVEDDLQLLLDILLSLKNSYNPNYQDMGVLAAVREYDAYVDTHSKSSDTWSSELLSKVQKEDPVALMVSLDEPEKQDVDSALFNIEAYLPPPLSAHYRSFKKTLVGWLVKLSIIPSHSLQEEGVYLQKAKKEHKKQFDVLNRASKSLAKTQAEYVELEGGLRWGRQGEWIALKHECVSQDIAEYTYELCFFDRATQRQQDRKSGGTNLGKFHSWNEDQEVEAGSEAFYSTQLYNKGQRCWNGPERSTVVEMVCGERNALIEVEELEKCAYKFLVSSPAACHESMGSVHLDKHTHVHTHAHDEL
ncbi:hypothetical protein E3P92_00126 [Wallemia ichthyophaga]|nr:hypothetical protein E3P92_00126 [Wallemia ichthyophaga]